LHIIHTSDWHLGQHFFGKSRANEQQAFLDWLIEQIQVHQVSALIVAGDIFDTGSPPSYAREMFNRFIVAMHQTQCQLVILGGNHDSVAMLNESKALVLPLGTHIVAQVEHAADQVIRLKDQQTNNTAALLCAVPFIRPRDVIKSQAGQSADEKKQSLQTTIAEHYQRLFQQAIQIKQDEGLNVPIIGTGHLTTVGASISDSVRDIYIGTLEAFPSNAFPNFDYLALGHIHRPQTIGQEYMRYCGSPIPLSFDEAKQTKQIVLVEFEGEKRRQITPLDVPNFQPLHIIKGDLDQIQEQFENLDTQTSDDFPTIWLEVQVDTDDYLNDLQTRINDMADTLPVEILKISRVRKQKQQTELDSKETLAELAIEDVFQRRLGEETWEGEEKQQQIQRLSNLFKKTLTDIQNEHSCES
jgi:exonuclease SbcD